MEQLQVTMSRQPLVVLEQRQLLDDVEFERLFLILDGLITRRRPFALLYIADYDGRPPMERGVRQGHWIRHNRAELSELCLGFAVVFTTPVIRFILSTMSLVQPFPFPWKTFSERQPAEDWLVAQLQNRGLTVPPPA